MRKLYPEEIEQIAFVNWLKLKKIFHFAVVNENTMSGINRFMAIKISERSKRMGKNKGVSDLVIMLSDKILFIEMKRRKTILKNGNLSTKELVKPEQYEFKNKTNSFSYAKGFIAFGCSEAIEIIENELKQSTM